MEKFVDRIIETDRKVREIIEQAQQEKQAVLADAKNAPMLRSPAAKPRPIRGRAAIDGEFAQREGPRERAYGRRLSGRQACAGQTPLRTGMTHGWPRVTQNTLAAL